MAIDALGIQWRRARRIIFQSAQKNIKKIPVLNVLADNIKGIFLVSLYFLNTLVWFSLILPLGLLKIAIPNKKFRNILSSILKAMAGCWVGFNSFTTRVVNKVEWDVVGLDNLKQDQWYLVLSNHQSWTDILVLQTIFHKKIPFLKFFLKKELIWVPLLGLAWWALDFPFMKRYSKTFLKKYPHLAGKDLETTKKACLKFKDNPVSIMNFVEGTRFTDEKHIKQNSPHSHLLKPKAGGVAFVLGAMGDQLDSILNVTISYPHKKKSFWDFMCGRVDLIRVRVEILPITENLTGDYFFDKEYSAYFRNWLNNLWDKKNNILMNMEQDS